MAITVRGKQDLWLMPVRLFVKSIDVSSRALNCFKEGVQLVYPSVNERRASVEGYQREDYVPGTCTVKNRSKVLLYRKRSSQT
jgi:hypothetical protein